MATQDFEGGKVVARGDNTKYNKKEVNIIKEKTYKNMEGLKDFGRFLLIVLDEAFGSRQLGNSEKPVNVKSVLLWSGFYLALFTACTYAIDRDFTGLITFFVIVILDEIVSMPRFFMRRKGKYDLEKKYLNVVKIIGIVFCFLVLIAVAVLLLNAKFHFWW